MQTLSTQLLNAKTVVFLMGPTASGKTDLVIELAKKLPISIISVDSALIYKGMDIGTAKPSYAIREKYPHSLIDICDPKQTYSAAGFNLDARREIKQAFSVDKIPVLVGGSNFYFRSLEYGLSPLPDSVPKIRQKLAQQYATQGLPILYNQLINIDPIAAQRLKPTDKQRIMRALEVYEISGKTLTMLQNLPKQHALTNPVIKIALMSDRVVLHQRIERRFYEMIEQGFLQEAYNLYQRKDIHINLASMRCVGYRQAWQYFLGKITKQEMIDTAIIATRQLCKRQNTWIRSEHNVKYLINPDVKMLLQLLANSPNI